MSTNLRIGTRGSQLALAQSESIADELRRRGHQVSVIVLKTTGDITPGSLTSFGGEGVFTKRLQIALLENEIDLAIHSLKDLPTDPVDGLKVAAVPSREDSRDALVLPAASTDITSLSDLRDNATIGTGSVRRKAQLLHLRPDLDIQDVRGNIDTRLAKLDAGDFDAIILASAGLNRLGLTDRITTAFEPFELAPATGQGALGLEIRSADDHTEQIITPLNEPATFAAVTAERTMLNRLRAGCLAPVGAVSVISNQTLSLSGMVFSRDGTQKIQSHASAQLHEAAELGTKVAENLIANGAQALMESP